MPSVSFSALTGPRPRTLCCASSQPSEHLPATSADTACSSVIVTCVSTASTARALCASSKNQRISSARSEEHTSELQSLMRISYAVFCLKKKKNNKQMKTHDHNITH